MKIYRKIKYYRKNNQYGGKGEKHGHGIMKYANGTKYEGMWKDGKKHGKGV